jgi:ribonuclease BN (tRNA processing enzyme)
MSDEALATAELYTVLPSRRNRQDTPVQLIVIGCSPAWPNAGGAQSGYLIEGEGRLLLDCGPGVLARLRTIDGGWPRVDAVAITHFHLDHWGDLVPWIFGASFGPGRSVPAPELWLPPGGMDRLRSFGKQMSFSDQIEGAFRVQEYDEDTAFRAAGFDVTALRLAHYSELTFGLRVSNHRSTLAYSGDTGPSRNLASLARDADVFLCEATLREPEPDLRGHLTEDEAVEAFQGSGARRLVVIHRPDELPLDPSLERAADGDVLTF